MTGRSDRNDLGKPPPPPGNDDGWGDDDDDGNLGDTVMQAPDPADIRRSSGDLPIVEPPISAEMASRNSATMLGVRPATATTEVRTEARTNLVPKTPQPPQRTKPSSTLPNPAIQRLPHKPERAPTDDRAPALRRRLKVTRTPAGYVVKDADTGQSCALNDSEYSIVRLCNGQRPMSEIVATARSLGLPVNVESVQAFIDKLDSQGFLVDDVVDAETQAFAPRGRWETGVRTLFQSGVRMLRTNNADEAARYFEAVLAQDPENVEARELLEMARTRVPTTPATQATPAPAAPRQTAQRVKSHTGDTLPPPARQLQPRHLAPPAPGWGMPHPSGRGVVYATPTTPRAVAKLPEHPESGIPKRTLVIVLAVAVAIVIGAIVWILVR